MKNVHINQLKTNWRMRNMKLQKEKNSNRKFVKRENTEKQK